MDTWLIAAISYIEMWLEFQMRLTDQPGCTIAITKGEDLVHEKAFGVADLSTGEKLSARHRFRVASHSKTFTAAGVLKLREQGRLQLHDAVGSFVKDLHPSVGAVTLHELLTHGGGLNRDGNDAGFFTNQRPFLSKPELLAELQQGPTLEAGLRAKYSNLGYGLLGLVIETVTAEPYGSWIMHNVIAPAGLRETMPDCVLDQAGSFARGHTSPLPFGSRHVITGGNETHALASATGFVSTASDLARFYAMLLPNAESCILSAQSRREMIQPHRKDTDAPVARAYGLGIVCGNVGSWDNFGHVGRFQGFISRTAVLPSIDVSVSVLTNAIDGPAPLWLDGIVHILRIFHDHGAPQSEAADWTGRWWSLWGATDLVAVGSHVRALNPALYPPFVGASEISLRGKDQGLVTKAAAPDRFGEAVVRSRDLDGLVTGLKIGGQSYVSEGRMKVSQSF